jgi:hypothetical protein
VHDGDYESGAGLVKTIDKPIREAAQPDIPKARLVDTVSINVF